MSPDRCWAEWGGEGPSYHLPASVSSLGASLLSAPLGSKRGCSFTRASQSAQACWNHHACARHGGASPEPHSQQRPGRSAPVFASVLLPQLLPGTWDPPHLLPPLGSPIPHMQGCTGLLPRSPHPLPSASLLRNSHVDTYSSISHDKFTQLLGRKWNKTCDSVQFSSVTQSCSALGDPMVCSTPGFPVHQQLLEPTQTHVH